MNSSSPSRHPGQVEGERAPPSLTLTVADSPETVAVDVLEMVTPHPPSVPALTWFCSGGVDAGTWNVGVGGAGFTVVEPSEPAPAGGVQPIVSVVGVPWTTKVAAMSMSPGTKLTAPVPGPVCQSTGCSW